MLSDGETAPDYCQTFISSGHCKVVLIAYLRAHPDAVLRKLIPKLQAFSKCIQEASMVRFYSSVYSDNKMLIREMSGYGVFHGIPHQIAAAHRTKTECLGSVPDNSSVTQFVSEICFFWRSAMIFEIEVAEMPLRYVFFLTCPQVAKSLECRPDQ
jgi:hypothetical protein